MKNKSFKDYCKEETPVNSTGAGVDMNPTGKSKKPFYKKMDRRTRWDLNKMFTKASGGKKA